MQSPTASLCATDAYSCLAITVLMAYRQALWGQLLAPSFVHWVALPRMCSSAPPRCPIRLQGIRPLPLRLPEAVKHPTQRRALAPPQMAWHQEAHGACCSRAAWSGPRCSRLKHVATGLARRRRLLVAVPLAPRGARPTRQAAQAMQQAAGGGLRHLPTAPGYAAAPLPAALPGGLEPAPPTEAAATPPAASAGSPPLSSLSPDQQPSGKRRFDEITVKLQQLQEGKGDFYANVDASKESDLKALEERAGPGAKVTGDFIFVIGKESAQLVAMQVVVGGESARRSGLRRPDLVDFHKSGRQGIAGQVLGQLCRLPNNRSEESREVAGRAQRQEVVPSKREPWGSRPLAGLSFFCLNERRN